MAATYPNSLLVEDGDALLTEARRELQVELEVEIVAATYVAIVVDADRPAGDSTPPDALTISDPTDANDGDEFKLQGTSVAMSDLATAGGFKNQAVLPRFSRGMSGGPGFKTIVQEVADGSEFRISKWQRPKRRFDISRAIDTREDFRRLVAHYLHVRGSLDGFRMRDPFDWSTHPNHVSKPDLSDPTHRQLIGAGDGTTKVYQLCKRYRFGNVSRVRPITHPQFQGSENDVPSLPGPYVGDPEEQFVNEIFVDNVQQAVGTDYSWTWNGGQIEFNTPPAVGAAIYWCGTFEVPVRFDQEIDQGLLANMATDNYFDIRLTATEISVAEPFSDHRWMGGAVDYTLGHLSIMDLSKGRFWNVTPTTSGQRLLVPSTVDRRDQGVFATVRNTFSTHSFDLYQWEQSSTKLLTLAQGEHAHLIVMADGTIKAIQ